MCKVRSGLWKGFMTEHQWYREAVMSQSPGLLQPWVSKSISFSTRNGLRELEHNRVAVELAIQIRNPG